MSKILEILKKAGLDGFLLALLSMILLAYIWPYPGMKNSAVPLNEISTYGVSLVFFFYGLRLDPKKFKTGLSNWRLHVLIHVATFILFPLIIFAFRPLAVGEERHMLWLAIFFLSVLPSTVSSSVVMVSIARGNIPAAIFNASISSLIGVFITPFWMSFVLEGSSTNYDLVSVVGKLSLQVLLPVTLGLFLNKKWGNWAEKNKKYIKYLDQSTILLIVYTSFCESFGEHLFDNLSLSDILFLGMGMLMLFFGIFFMLTYICRFLGFSHEDEITAVFCGSKKSLVQGAVMSKVLFSGAQAGLMLLPVMLYHALQLIVASIIAQRFARKTDILDKNG